jgi:hypothetical protein
MYEYTNVRISSPKRIAHVWFYCRQRLQANTNASYVYLFTSHSLNSNVTSNIEKIQKQFSGCFK